METLQNIIENYQHICRTTEKELQKVRQRIRNISLLRLLLFVAAVVGVSYFWGDDWRILLVCAGVPFLAFVWLVKRHNVWFHRKDFLKKKIEINQQELQAIGYDFSSFDGGEEYIDPAHLYTYDLDVFGEHSLFQSINRSSTPAGKVQLAAWLNAHLEKKEEIEQRQQAVRELAPEVTFRQTFRISGLLYKGKPADMPEIGQWASAPTQYRRHRLLRLLPGVVSAINIVCIACAFLGLLPASLAGVVFVCFVIFSFVFSKGITKMQATYGEKLQILSTYAEQILQIEQKELNSAALQEIKTILNNGKQSASHAVRRLSKLMNALDQRNNVLMSTVLNGLFFWELRQVMRIEQWKEEHAADLTQWLNAVGRMDAYCSLATFAYNHPDYVYPTISQHPFCLKAEALGHPLMDRDKCVRNGISIEKRPFFIIITGANMAGKSTYLRTVGVNYLLACIGLPVWSRQMELYPARLITSLRTSDSLTDNESYFFAELKRLKLIIDKLQAGEELFIILDEILKGTNSVDKQKGSLALIRQFVNMNTNGIIATHDLMLSSLAESFPKYIRNHCFEADITDNELTFSYRMRDGVAQNMNACFLMKKMGIAVVDD